jgi:hypothetical protein
MLRFTSALLLTSLNLSAAETVQERVSTVTNTPGLVAFWDFTKRGRTTGPNNGVRPYPAGGVTSIASFHRI